jgi:hypothetical protein
LNSRTIRYKAEPSSHISAARLPHDLEPGAHRITVRVVDEYGREHLDNLVMELTAGDRNPKAGSG